MNVIPRGSMAKVRELLPLVRMSSHDYVGLTPKEKDDIKSKYKYLVKHKDKDMLFASYNEVLKMLSYKGMWGAARKLRAINIIQTSIIHGEKK